MNLSLLLHLNALIDEMTAEVETTNLAKHARLVITDVILKATLSALKNILAYWSKLM